MFTIHLCAERILLVCLKVGGGGAPQLSIAASGGGARVVGLALVDEGEHARLTARVATVDWSWSFCVNTCRAIRLLNQCTCELLRSDNASPHKKGILSLSVLNRGCCCGSLYIQLKGSCQNISYPTLHS